MPVARVSLKSSEGYIVGRFLAYLPAQVEIEFPQPLDGENLWLTEADAKVLRDVLTVLLGEKEPPYDARAHQAMYP